MLNIFRNRRARSTESKFLLRLGLLLVVPGATLTAMGIYLRLSDATISDTFWAAMAISVSILLCGIGALAHRWRLDRNQRSAGGSP